jgi:large subunit ribosomal protein L21
VYAIIQTGGNQYRVAEGDTIDVELLEAEEGATIELPEVLLVGTDADVRIGTPFVDGALVKANVLGEEKGDKLTVFKYKPKNRYRVKTGHRQKFTRLKIDSISI